MEKIIVNRINASYKEAGSESPDQILFRIGKCIDDAFLNFRRAIRFTEKKFVATTFIDIVGAFDNL